MTTTTATPTSIRHLLAIWEHDPSKQALQGQRLTLYWKLLAERARQLVDGGLIAPSASFIVPILRSAEHPRDSTGYRAAVAHFNTVHVNMPMLLVATNANGIGEQAAAAAAAVMTMMAPIVLEDHGDASWDVNSGLGAPTLSLFAMRGSN
jgi:hypothetical protein